MNPEPSGCELTATYWTRVLSFRCSMREIRGNFLEPMKADKYNKCSLKSGCGVRSEPNSYLFVFFHVNIGETTLQLHVLHACVPLGPLASLLTPAGFCDWPKLLWSCLWRRGRSQGSRGLCIRPIGHLWMETFTANCSSLQNLITWCNMAFSSSIPNVLVTSRSCCMYAILFSVLPKDQ